MQTHKIDILDVATYLVKHQNKDDFTRMKIQKLVFLTYCKYLLKGLDFLINELKARI
ncbi:hypothetical protein [Candidatus Phytoplasma australiense]|uniref:Phage-Associated Protein n=1 Tax=Strawberry lethal yellows phytoplasma (CPA) str. NZSb11 TaxID=980422 RepID=R4RMG1_PHYAS|nr:hypothetical protein [Candidatus Phytoplasma australiense]AGL90086.1 Phage-Associated Protein [Strawberry lethal yellows phytoplasma (CPA) str. NZSb11]AGL90490.1 Phage-Associated Protein [Strawberry lethal yellows phytoplasma (CPA) str. NZSb11]